MRLRSREMTIKCLRVNQNLITWLNKLRIYLNQELLWPYGLWYWTIPGNYVGNHWANRFIGRLRPLLKKATWRKDIRRQWRGFLRERQVRLQQATLCDNLCTWHGVETRINWCRFPIDIMSILMLQEMGIPRRSIRFRRQCVITFSYINLELTVGLV